MPHRHRCFYCGRQAIAFDEHADGERTYLCEHHVPNGGEDDQPSLEAKGQSDQHDDASGASRKHLN
jgi:hypothetical protein